MNPSMNESPNTAGINLPPPVANQAPTPASPFEAMPAATPEAAPAPAMQAPTAQPAPMPLPTMPAPQMPVQDAPAPTQGVVSKTTKSVVATVVDDGDLIEKEWVDKAKKIVEANRDDPYKQSEELTSVRAEYMQTHYNKTIKVSK